MKDKLRISALMCSGLLAGVQARALEADFNFTFGSYPASINYNCDWQYQSDAPLQASVANVQSGAVIASIGLGGKDVVGTRVMSAGGALPANPTGEILRLYAKQGGTRTSSYNSLIMPVINYGLSSDGGNWSLTPYAKSMVTFIAEPDGSTGGLAPNEYSFLKEPDTGSSPPAWSGRTLSFSYSEIERNFASQSGTWDYFQGVDCGG